jgi:hypothetical protein
LKGKYDKLIFSKKLNYLKTMQVNETSFELNSPAVCAVKKNRKRLCFEKKSKILAKE